MFTEGPTPQNNKLTTQNTTFTGNTLRPADLLPQQGSSVSEGSGLRREGQASPPGFGHRADD